MSYLASYLGPEGFGTYDVDWSQGEPTFTRVSKPPELLLVPGFVDIHIHGAFGIDFMSASTEEMGVLCEKLSRQGYEAFCPTTVTAPLPTVLGAISNLPSHPKVAGFHLEGPFISDAYPGAQPVEAIVESGSKENWDAIFEHPQLRIVTLAPERPDALPLITKLAQRNVIVSMGHTNATWDEARFAYEFGARHATHLFNAMRPLHHREPGVVGYCLHNDDISTELIYDRLHVSKEAVKMLLKWKPIDRVIAVSDSTLATGMPPGQKITMWGHECVTGKGEVRLANGVLAGSAITLLHAFRNLTEDFGVEVAIKLCSLNPRRALGLDRVRKYLEFDKNLEMVGQRVASA